MSARHRAAWVGLAVLIGAAVAWRGFATRTAEPAAGDPVPARGAVISAQPLAAPAAPTAEQDEPGAPGATPSPCDMTLAELEAAYGENLLVADPSPDGYGPPAGAREVALLRRWYGSQAGVLNGLAINDANVVDGICEYITMSFGIRHRGEPSRWAPAVADYASWSVDRRIVTVRLRRGIRWQFPAVDRDDPRHAWLGALFAKERPELTTADVAFTHRVMLDPGLDYGGLRAAYEDSTLRVLDRFTFQVTWEDPTIHSFIHSLSWQTILPEFLFSRDEDGNPIPQEVIGAAVKQHWYNRRACGYGPYEFVRMEPDQRIVLRRMDDFPVFRPAVREIHWEIIKDPEQVAQRLMAGDIDMITLQPQQYVTYLRDAKPGQGVRVDSIKTKSYIKAEYMYVAWNERKPPFDDKRVRRAMSHAIDAESIFQRVFAGTGNRITNHLPPDHPYFRNDLPPIAFDLDAASKLLEAAGWKDGDGDGVLEKDAPGGPLPFRFTFIGTNDSPEVANLLALVKEDLKKIGVAMNVRLVPVGEYFATVLPTRGFDAMLGLWASAYDTDFRSQFHSRGDVDGNNYPGYKNPEIDELSERFVRTFDRDEQKKVAWRIQEILHEDQPYTFLLRRTRWTAYASWLDHVEFSPWRPQLVSFGWCRAKS